MTRCVLAGLVMTTGIALVFAALYPGDRVNLAGAVQWQRPAVAAVVPADAPWPRTEQVADAEDGSQEDVMTPPRPQAFVVEAKAKRVRISKAPVVSRTSNHDRLFPASTRSQASVYGLFANGGFAQGGN